MRARLRNKAYKDGNQYHYAGISLDPGLEVNIGREQADSEEHSECPGENGRQVSPDDVLPDMVCEEMHEPVPESFLVPVPVSFLIALVDLEIVVNMPVVPEMGPISFTDYVIRYYSDDYSKAEKAGKHCQGLARKEGEHQY